MPVLSAYSLVVQLNCEADRVKVKLVYAYEHNSIQNFAVKYKNKIMKMKNKYQVVCYMRIETEKVNPLTHKEALDEKEQDELMQPENIYQIEKI